MEWKELAISLKEFYIEKGLQARFAQDERYLSQAYIEIERLWLAQFHKIQTIKYIMLSEAPLWGLKKKYIYNPEIRNSQFFYRSDLEHILDVNIHNKTEFIEYLGSIGFIIIDISPYALNSKDTQINYRELPIQDYRLLLKNTIPIYFVQKLALMKHKLNGSVKIFYRYGRVKNAFNDLIGKTIYEAGLVEYEKEIFDISQQGGGIDRQKLKKIIFDKV